MSALRLSPGLAVRFVIVFGALLVAALPAIAAPRRFNYTLTRLTVSDVQIGPYLTYPAMLQHFQQRGLNDPTARFSIFGCTLQWSRVGLGFEFNGQGAPNWPRATPSTCRTFFRVTATGQAWHTTNGLRVGMPVASLKRFYPHAFDGGLGKPPPGVRNWCAYWNLVGPTTAGGGLALMACTTGGRVAALFVQFVGH